MNCNIISPSLFAVPLWGHHRSPKKHHFFDQIVSQRSEGGILIQKKRTFLPKVSKRLVNALPESLRSYIWFQQTQTVAISFGFRWSTAVWFGSLKKGCRAPTNLGELNRLMRVVPPPGGALFGIEGSSAQQVKYPPTWKKTKTTSSFKRYLWMEIR